MNTKLQLWTGGLAALLAFGLLLGPVVAQVPEAPDQPTPEQPTPDQPKPKAERDMRKAEKTTDKPKREVGEASCLRASKLWGTETADPEGKPLGEIDNLAIDVHTGNIEYAVLSVGGFADIGDKLFAIPWSTLDIYGTRNNQIIVPFPKERFEHAQGFDEKNWPKEADSLWALEGRERERKVGETREERERETGETREERERPTGETTGGEAGEGPLIYRLTNVLDKEAKSLDGASLGKFHDLVIDRDAGRIALLAVGESGLLEGDAGKTHAVPWSLVRLHTDGSLRLDISSEQFTSAPVVNWDDEAQTCSRAWIGDVYTHYDARPYWEGRIRTGEREEKKAK